MNLILTGGGSGEQTKEIDELFASLLDKSKPLLYIPIAIDNIKHPYPECLKWLKTTFDKLGVQLYRMITNDDLKNARQMNITDYAGIYIGGGNTPYLLKKLKQSKLWNKLKEAIKKDIPIYGGSAGAIIFSKTIKPSTYFDKNWIELKKFEGMNKIKKNHLFCHYTDKKEQQIKTIITNEKLDTSIALTEKNALYITKKEIKLIGQEPAWQFDKAGNKKEIRVNETIQKKPINIPS